jgi:RNA polymerase sigma-70 factor, ECF subfamily
MTKQQPQTKRENMLDQHPPQERDLMRRIADHDQTALASLYEHYARAVFSLAYRVLQNQQLAEEAAQDTFVKVWRQAANWDPEKGRLSSWILTIAHRTAIDRLRMENRQALAHAASIDEVAPPESETGLPDDPVLHDGRHLRYLMRQIPSEQAELIDLAFFQGLTHRELAERLELPLGTVKTRVRLGLQKLRALWIETTEQQKPVD